MFGYVQTLAVDTLIMSASMDTGRAGFRTVMNVSLEGDTEVSYLSDWSIFLDFEPGLWKGSGFVLFSGHRCILFLLSSPYREGLWGKQKPVYGCAYWYTEGFSPRLCVWVWNFYFLFFSLITSSSF